MNWDLEKFSADLLEHSETIDKYDLYEYPAGTRFDEITYLYIDPESRESELVSIAFPGSILQTAVYGTTPLPFFDKHTLDVYDSFLLSENITQTRVWYVLNMMIERLCSIQSNGLSDYCEKECNKQKEKIFELRLGLREIWESLRDAKIEERRKEIQRVIRDNNLTFPNGIRPESVLELDFSYGPLERH